MTHQAPDPPEPRVNILLVDDLPANLLALEAILAPLGQNLVKAPSGQRALRCLLEQDCAVVILDVRMRDLDGFETARLIRGRDRSRHTPIVFLTAHDRADFPPEKAYTLGAVDYLHKPLMPEVLRTEVAGFVDLFQKTQQVVENPPSLRVQHRLVELAALLGLGQQARHEEVPRRVNHLE